MNIKNIIRQVLLFLHIDLTKNLEYDRLTAKIMRQVLSPGKNCLDIGCHKGEMLEQMIKLAPGGKHFGFEPIPHMYDNLCKVFKDKATILPYALSAKEGTSTFNWVKNAPAYSGIQKRNYDTANPDIELIHVQLKRLDDVIPADLKIDLVKIDVEGGEFDVLKGGIELMKRNKPVLIFECGTGASNYYGTKPADIYQFITNDIGLRISTLKSFIKKDTSLSEKDFIDLFETNKEYYFIAHA
jgi:FkbM family methyltransferase